MFCTDFTAIVAFFISTNWLGHTLVHCPKFPTAAKKGLFAYPLWLIPRRNQLKIIGYP